MLSHDWNPIPMSKNVTEIAKVDLVLVYQSMVIMVNNVPCNVPTETFQKSKITIEENIFV